MASADCPYVSRGGLKLAAALRAFGVDVHGLTCADLGSHVGGFVDCLLIGGAARVFAVDTGYGVLAWRLRKDPRVVTCERTNALHFVPPTPCDLVTIDVGWTPQRLILGAAKKMIGASGLIVTLVKPHYEAPREWLRGGVLMPERVDETLAGVRAQITALSWMIRGEIESPVRGHGGNVEFLALLTLA
ncbi:MAG: SAM-dependent methyltransferase [Phycisphaerae bacterium]